MTDRLVHKGCGGEVQNRKCLKCNKKWRLLSMSFSEEVVKEISKFSPKAYRKRIRDGDDIFK